MSDEQTRKEEWEEIFRDIEAKFRKEAAKLSGAEPTDDWETIGQKMEEKIRAEAATGVGGEPEEDWEQIGKRIGGNLKSEVAKVADADQSDDWDTIGHKMEGKIRSEIATGAGLTKVSVRTQGSSLSDPDITFPAVSQHVSKDDYNIYLSTDIGPTVSAIIAHVQVQQDTLIDLRVERPSLEDRFLEITTTGGAQ